MQGRLNINDDETPRAFYKEGVQGQLKYQWICVDYYYKGDYQQECWYYFDDGIFVQQRWAEAEGKRYYLGKFGAYSGWFSIKSNYYYFDLNERYMWTSGNVERDGQMYTIGSDGIAREASALGYSGSIVDGGGDSGWAEEEGKRYYLQDGVRVRAAWLQDGAVWYYLDENGYTTKGICEIDGAVYFFDNVTGQRTSGTTGFYQKQKYLFGEDGKGVPIEMTTEEKISQSDVVKWMAATYAIYTNAEISAQMLGADTSASEMKKLLVNDWGITGREDGVATIDNLAASALTASDKVTKAWDYSRAMMLCDILYHVDYITRIEKIEKQYSMAPAIQVSFGSWSDFNDNYMAGYRRWANATGYSDSIAFRETLYQNLLKSANSPYKLNWGLDLTKDW